MKLFCFNLKVFKSYFLNFKMEDVGDKIKKIRLGHDNKGLGAGKFKKRKNDFYFGLY